MRLIRYRSEFQEPMLALHRSAIEGFSLGMSQQQDEADLMAVEDVYLRTRGEFLLGFLGERLVAMGGFKRVSDNLAELRRMRIARDLQGRGYGTMMLRELERIAFHCGIRTLRLDTARRRPLTLEFYRKHGYQESGRSFYGSVETVQFEKALDDVMNIEICPFRMATYDSVLALWKQCEGIGLSEADSRESIQAYLSRNPGMSFIATVDGALVGAVLCGHDGRRGYIHHLAVHPQSRRRSIGRRLVERCLRALKQAGIQKCHIFIFNQNEGGIAFWKSAGWSIRNHISVISKSIEPGQP